MDWVKLLLLWESRLACGCWASFPDRAGRIYSQCLLRFQGVLPEDAKIGNSFSREIGRWTETASENKNLAAHWQLL